MIVLQLAILILVAATGTAVVFSRNAESQPIGISFYGLVLSIMFFIFQAPDVALSQLVIGAVGLPLMIMLALARLRRPDR